MSDMHDPRISALLRLKRHEQPPPGYFDRLLSEVHRRQRAELLHRPLWKIALERMQVFFGEHSMGNMSYAGAMAVLLAAGIAIIGLMTPGDAQNVNAGPVVARDTVQEPVQYADAGSANRTLILGPQTSSESVRLITQPRAGFAPEISAPRYIMDSRPVSYDPGDRF